MNNGTLILEPQKFENKEIGVKWQLSPRLLYTAAVYDLERTNVPLADPNNPGFFIVSGKNRIKGYETSLTGYVTPDWQSTLGYANTDARVTSDTSTTIVAGNRVQLVPQHQFSWWNKYQFTPVWAASVGVIYFSDLFASSDDTVRLPGFVRVDAAVYARINEILAGAGQRRERVQQGLLGVGRRQQQPVARPAAHCPPDGDRQVLECLLEVPLQKPPRADDTYGEHAVKLPAGHMIVYPGDSVHHVNPVTRGSRIASFFWTQSMVRDVTQRRLLFDLDLSIMRLTADHPEHPSLVTLTSLYHNLLRQWAEL